MNIKTLSLTPESLQIIRDKGTEYPHTGAYNTLDRVGTYLCRQCGLALFRSDTKFTSSCGWPSFDADINHHVTEQPDKDGKRLEIMCQRCHAHLGHVFRGENYTRQNTRYCVNSLSLDFVTNSMVIDTEEAIFAGGCFWGVEYLLKKLPGVLKIEVGYTGGHISHPSYQEVCGGLTGHYEAVRVIYDVATLNYTDLLKYFFEIHDPMQKDGQGPDKGPQYLSAIFYFDETQQRLAEQIIQTLKNKNYNIATRLLPVSIFWSAEEYHQNYYEKKGGVPYCHRYVKRF